MSTNIIVQPAASGQFEHIARYLKERQIERYYLAGLIDEQEKDRLLGKEARHATRPDTEAQQSYSSNRLALATPGPDRSGHH